jgi:RNA polymerase sigma factor (sigma-70 family)
MAGATADDDLALLERWRAGDGAAGNDLFRRHFEALYRFFEHKTDGEIDDLVQETFLACLRGRDVFRRHSSFRTYLFAIARNHLFGYWRRRKAGPSPLDFENVSVAALSTSIDTRLSRKQDRAALLAALRALPLDQQLLLEMFYWEELERDQLAEVFEVAAATIGSRLFRARQALHDSLTAITADPAVAPVTGEHPGDFDNWARALGRNDREPVE